MKNTFTALLAIVSAIVLLQFSACASRKEAPDPVKVQEEIAEYRNQERELVLATIPDPGRADRLIRLLGERDKLISDSTQIINEYRERMWLLNADYDADRESFETLVASYNSQRAAMQEKFTTLIGTMKMEMNPEEWKVISRFQLKRLHPRQLTYGQAAAGD